MNRIASIILVLFVGAAGAFAGGMWFQSTTGSMPAAMDHSAMPGMTMGTPKGDQGPSSTDFAKVNADMHAAMDIEFTGNADKDFARGMIAHHQGAVEMAKVQLQYGADPEMRKLAEDIIAAQQPEIDQMTKWLAANP